MKKNIFTISCIVYCFAWQASAQTEFAPVGTEWYYGLELFTPFNIPVHTVQYSKVSSVGNIEIGGKLCNTIRQTRATSICVGHYSLGYVYQSNDTVFLYIQNYDEETGNLIPSGEFTPLYIFSADVGDSWRIKSPFPLPSDIIVTVEEVDYITIFGQQRKQMLIKYVYDDESFFHSERYSVIIEGIGDPYHVLPDYTFDYRCCCDDWFSTHTGLRCYVHPEYGTYHAETNIACDYETPTSISESNTSPLKISQNNASLNFESKDDKIISIQITNLQGKTIHKNNAVNSFEYTINLKMETTILLCTVVLESGKLINKKVFNF